MKTKRFLMFFLMFMMIFIQIPEASTTDNYKQGVYDISDNKECNITAKLITPKNTTSLIIVNSDGVETFHKKMDNVDETINVGILKKGDHMIIAGKGEIIIRCSK